MLHEALTGAAIGAAFAALLFALIATGLERRAQGLVSSLGFLGLIGACLALDGWIATAIPGFVAAVVLGIRLRGALRDLSRPKGGGGGA